MNSRDKILDSIRANQRSEAEVPLLKGDWTRYADPLAKFAEVTQSVGGVCVAVNTLADVSSFLNSNPRFANRNSVISRIPGIESTLDLNEVDRPHDLNAIDLAVLPGELGVAENGAVWVDSQSLKHRAVLFIVEHLVLVVSSSRVVSNMHQAYELVTFDGSHFGCFISGPSKTADIEQSLVIGAQGPRAHTVFLVNDPF